MNTHNKRSTRSILIVAISMLVSLGATSSLAQNVASRQETSVEPQAKNSAMAGVIAAKADPLAADNVRAGREDQPTRTLSVNDISSISREKPTEPTRPNRLRLSVDPTDFVTLKNGDRLSGKIQESDGQTITIGTEYAGDVKIKWEAVDGFASSEKLQLNLRDGQRIVGTVTTAAGGQVSIQTAEAGVITTSREAITGVKKEASTTDKAADVAGVVIKKTGDAAKDAGKVAKDIVTDAGKAAKDATTGGAVNVPAGVYKYPGLTEGWAGVIDIGLILGAGNTNLVNFLLHGDAVRETASDRLTLFATSIYQHYSQRGESATPVDAFRFGGRYDWKLGERTSFFGFAQAEGNDVQGVDFRFSLGGGGNRRLINTDRKKLDVYLGLAYTRDYYESDFFFDEPDFDPDDLSKSSIELLIGDEYTWRINDRLRLKQRLDFFPNLTDFGEFRLNFNLDLTADLTDRIAWNTSLGYRVFTNPPPGFNMQDVLLSTGIRFKFGR